MNVKVLFLTVLFCFLAACDGMEERKQKYLSMAQESFDKKNYEKASVDYKNVLKIDPKDVDALLGFAATLEKLKDYRGAVSRYRAVIELDPTNNQAKNKLGQMLLLANQVDQAFDLAEEVLAADPQNVGGMTLKAAGLGRKGQFQEALNLIEQAYKLNSSDLDAIIMYSALLKANDRADEALALLEKSIQAIPDSVSLHSLLAQYYAERNQLLLAEKQLKKLIEIEPEEIQFKRQLVVFYERTDRPEDAERVFSDMIASHPDNTDAVVGLHELYVSRNHLDKAEALLKQHIANDKENFDLQFILASFYVKTDRVDEAETMYRSFLEENDKVATKAKNRLAYLKAEQNDIAQADKLIAEVLEQQPGNIEALTLRGKLYLQKEDAVNAIPDLRAAVNANPENIEIIKMLAQAHILNGENELATELLKNVVRMNQKDVASRMQLVELLLRTDQTEQALKHALAADQQVPNNLKIKQKLFQTYVALGRSSEAKFVANELIAMDDTNPLFYFYSGSADQLAKNHELAIVNFDKAMELKPGALEPMSAKVRSMIVLQKLDEAVQWLGAMAEELGNNPAAYNFKGEILLAQSKHTESLAAFEKAIEISPEWWMPYRNKAIVASAMHNTELGKSSLEAGIKASEGAAPLRMALAAMLEKENNMKGAIDQYEHIVKQDTKNTVAMNNLAMLLVSQDQIDQASLTRAAQLSASLSQENNPLFKDTIGWVYYAQGEFEKALPLLKSASEAHPNNPEIQYHLGMTYFKISDFEKAKTYLVSAVESESSFRGEAEAKDTLNKLQNELASTSS